MRGYLRSVKRAISQVTFFNGRLEKLSQIFEEVWDFLHVIGCIADKHVCIDCRKLTGTFYHNYRGFFITVLLAICEADYCFTLSLISVVTGVIMTVVFGSLQWEKHFESCESNLIPDELLNDWEFSLLPYFLLGDDIFPLKNFH